MVAEDDEVKMEQPEHGDGSFSTNSSITMTAATQWLSQALGGGADPVTASAIWMLLQSQAERRHDDDNNHHHNAIVTPHETLLGCASLQVHFQNSSSHLSHVATTWAAVLQQLVPLVRVVDLSELTAPYQSSGRLHPNVLQLPAGSVLIVTCPNSSGQQPEWSSLKQQRQTLQSLCQGHRLPYCFDGGCRIAFEADYRILVLTSGSEPLFDFGCTLQVHCGPPRAVSAAPPQLARHLRRHLAQGRALGNVSVPPAVLERAQHDFLQRRATNRAATGEREFHQWLTLTRLHARSRAVTEATPDDWEAALHLHQALRATMTLDAANAGSPA